MELFFDTETSGLYNFKLEPTHPKQPWIVQIAAILCDEENIYSEFYSIIAARDRNIEPGAEKVHCISKELSNKVGINESDAISTFGNMTRLCDKIICHNFQFDSKLMLSAIEKHKDSKELKKNFTKNHYYCTMESSTNLLKLPGNYGKFKWPKLQELHYFLFGACFIDAHDALEDVRATRRCYYELIKRLEKKDK